PPGGGEGNGDAVEHAAQEDRHGGIEPADQLRRDRGRHFLPAAEQPCRDRMAWPLSPAHLTIDPCPATKGASPKGLTATLAIPARCLAQARDEPPGLGRQPGRASPGASPDHNGAARPSASLISCCVEGL